VTKTEGKKKRERERGGMMKERERVREREGESESGQSVDRARRSETGARRRLVQDMRERPVDQQPIKVDRISKAETEATGNTFALSSTHLPSSEPI